MNIPKGLEIQKARTLYHGWKVIHKASGLTLASMFRSRASATRFVNALADIDWTQPIESLRTEAIIKRALDAYSAEAERGRVA